jgi:hypothetical protein
MESDMALGAGGLEALGICLTIRSRHSAKESRFNKSRGWGRERYFFL